MEQPDAEHDLESALTRPGVSSDGRWILIDMAWDERFQQNLFPPICVACQASTSRRIRYPIDRYHGISVSMCEACEDAYRRRFGRIMLACALPFLPCAVVVGWLLWEPGVRLGKQIAGLCGPSAVLIVGIFGSFLLAKWLASPIKVTPLAMLWVGAGPLWVRFTNQAFVQAYVDFYRSRDARSTYRGTDAG